MIIRTLHGLILALALTSTTALAEDPPQEPTDAEQPAESATPATTPEPIPRTEPNIDANRVNELIKHLDPITEVVQLDTGKEGETMVAFYRPEGSGIKQGGIILFPDTETHTDWPDTLRILRTTLSDYGWHTLSVYLPATDRPTIPERTLPVLAAIKPISTGEEVTDEEPQEESEQTEATTETTPEEPEAEATTPPSETTTESSTGNSEPKEKYEEKIYRFGQTGLRYLQENAGIDRIIVLGVGSGATWAAKYVEAHQEHQNLRLVMIDAREPNTSDAPSLQQIIPQLQVTIIDLHHSPQYSSLALAAQSSPGQRLRLARQKRMNNYHQSRLPAQQDDRKNSNNRLAKHARGLINTYIIKAEQGKRNIQLDNNANKSDENAPG